jgi:DNA-binding MarR family transcriptional regulator
LNSLEEKGLITRRIDSDDRRKIIVEITPKGTEHIENLHREATENLKRLLMTIGEKDSKEFVRILGRLSEVLSKE